MNYMHLLIPVLRIIGSILMLFLYLSSLIISREHKKELYQSLVPSKSFKGDLNAFKTSLYQDAVYIPKVTRERGLF